MSRAAPHRSFQVEPPDRAKIAFVREREEALEARAKRRSAEIAVDMAAAEVGHLRFGLIERATSFVVWLICVGLALAGAIPIPLLILAVGISAHLGISVLLSRRRAGKGGGGAG